MSPAGPARADDKAEASMLSAAAAFVESLKAQETGHPGAEQEPELISMNSPGSEAKVACIARVLLQSRASQVLALTLMGELAVGLLGWYYLHTFAQRGTAQRTAQSASRNQAAGDAPLPSLGPITLPEIPVERILARP